MLLFVLLSHQKDKGCHDQGIPVDLCSLYSGYCDWHHFHVNLLAMFTHFTHTPRNIFFKCQSAKAGVIPSRRSVGVLARVLAHWQFRALSSVSWSPSKHIFCKTSVSPPLVIVGTYLDWMSCNICAISAALFGFRNCRPRGHFVVNKKKTIDVH